MRMDTPASREGDLNSGGHNDYDSEWDDQDRGNDDDDYDDGTPPGSYQPEVCTTSYHTQVADLLALAYTQAPAASTTRTSIIKDPL